MTLGRWTTRGVRGVRYGSAGAVPAKAGTPQRDRRGEQCAASGMTVVAGARPIMLRCKDGGRHRRKCQYMLNLAGFTQWTSGCSQLWSVVVRDRLVIGREFGVRPFLRQSRLKGRGRNHNGVEGHKRVD